MTHAIASQPWWHPEAFGRRLPNLKKRQAIVKTVRAFFDEQDFTEVETPALQISPGLETHLHAFATAFENPLADQRQDYYLHTSPEFSMKKLLVAGLPKIFQLSHVFRNGERSSLHHPEFSMLEWYRAGECLPTLMDDCIRLVRASAAAADLATFSSHGVTCDPFEGWDVLSVPEAFLKFAQIDLLTSIGDTVVFRQQVRNAGMRATDEDDWDDLFFRVMGEKIEPFLGTNRPTFLCDYPVSMAALAKPSAIDPRLAERFELYMCGVEIANAFEELTDPDEQKRRFAHDMDCKERLYGERYPIDDDFIAALRYGMPSSAGIALGFDRLVMLCTGVESIADVLWAPVASEE